MYLKRMGTYDVSKKGGRDINSFLIEREREREKGTYFFFFDLRVSSPLLLHFVSWVENAKWIKIQVCDQTQIQKRPLVSCSSWSGERWERTIGVSKDLEFSRRLEFSEGFGVLKKIGVSEGFEILKKVLEGVQEFWPNRTTVNL